MIDKITNYLINNKVIAFLILVLVIVFGLITSPFDFANGFLPRNSVTIDAIPDIGENQQIVFTAWEGQSPRDIEDQITYPLSSNLLGIPGVKSIRSNSMFGFSSVYIIFEDDIEFYWSRSRILEKLNSLPKNLFPEGVQPKLGPDATALGQVFWYTLEGRDAAGKVTGGWDLAELRSIQDFYVKSALSATQGVAEVASIGGFVKEYQIDVNPELLKQYGISLQHVVDAIKGSNRDIGAQTLEINQAEYFVRGLGYITSIEDIESTSIVSEDFTAITIRDVAHVKMGPAERRGILDKGGAEVVGGVVTARYGANPMQVVQDIRSKLKLISSGLPKKKLNDGRISQLTIVPFYDRSVLIGETLQTLGSALFFEILIAILVVVVLLRNLKVSVLISGLLPLAVLAVFIAMKLFKVDANIVALSGIAIAIGTVVDMGIILTENIVRHQEEYPENTLKKNLINASNEVSGAILTAGLTTIISFIPVFALTGAEGKLFSPLAFTKTIALFASIGITLFAIPPMALLVLKKVWSSVIDMVFAVFLIGVGLLACFWENYIGLFLVGYGTMILLKVYQKIDENQEKWASMSLVLLGIIVLLTIHWRPLGFGVNLFFNGIFIVLLITLVLLPFRYFLTKYEVLLRWVLDNKWLSISVPLVLVVFGIAIMLTSEKEFMPTLDEGDFLLMPTSLPHAGISENNEVLKKLDMAVSSLPEIEYAVGKAGRVESALDPAPLSMYENLISYKPEYILDTEGRPIRFKTNEEGRFITKSGTTVSAGENVSADDLIQDKYGRYYRNWRPHIGTVEDIWIEISKTTKLPGVTSAPKLQPIETRLVMLQTGMRSNLGVKVKGQDLEEVEAFALVLEHELKSVDGILKESVFADRIVGKPYLLLDIDRGKLARYGLRVEDVQQTLEIAVGGKVLAQTVEGRERYGIRVRYPRELRGTPDDLKTVYVSLQNGSAIPISEFVDVRYEKGPQSIKSEDGFLVSYIIFDKKNGISEVAIVERARELIDSKIANGEIQVPLGVSYEFSGTFENHIRSQKTLTLVIPMVLLIILMLLYFQFRSISVSLMVFSGVAVAFAGGFILIWLYGQPWFMDFEIGQKSVRDLFNMRTINLSVAVWVGFIALFGIATDDGVVMGTYLNQSFKKSKTDSIEDIKEAVVSAGKKRIRPCLMTTATTILALLPILTSSGKGSRIMVPMAIPAFGGMLIALITLFVVPLLFCWQKEILLRSKGVNP
jgi:Cu(I)/Ag(I) efflux system membrane protein CusA/SilA